MLASRPVKTEIVLVQLLVETVIWLRDRVQTIGLKTETETETKLVETLTPELGSAM